MIKIVREQCNNVLDGQEQITGYVDGRAVIKLSNRIEGEWVVGHSSSLPTDIVAATEYLECFQQAFDELDKVNEA